MKIQRSGLGLLPLLSAMIITAFTAVGRKGHTSWDDLALQRKADYVYLEALNRSLDNKRDAFHDLIGYAHRLNPADLTIANDYGLMTFMTADGDSAMSQQAIGLMKRYFDSHPEDFYSGAQYALVNQSIGNTRESLRAFARLHRQFPRRPMITRRYADLLAMSGNNDSVRRALSLYDTLEVTEGPGFEISTARINLLYMLHDTAAIINEGRAHLLRSGQDVGANVFMADVFNAMSMPDSARIYYDIACEIDPANPQAAYSRAVFYNTIGDSAAYDREIFKVLKLEDLPMPTKMEVMRNYVSELYNDSLQTPRVLALFDSLTALHPHEPDLRKMYAVYLASTGSFGDAAEQQDMGMSLEPDDDRGWKTLASFYSIAHNDTAALKAVDRGIHYFPDEPELYLMRGSLNLEKENYGEALSDFNTALAYTDTLDTSDYSDVLTGIGDVYSRMEMPDSAISTYYKAIKIYPSNYGALNNLAYFLAVEGRDLDEALAMIERVIDNNEPNATWADTYAWVLYRRGDIDKARQQIDRVIELVREHPDDAVSAEVLEHAGDIYFAAGETDKAIEFWRHSFAVTPNERVEKKIRQKSAD